MKSFFPSYAFSLIAHPKLHSKGHFLHYGQWLDPERKPSYQARLRAAIIAALEQHPADFDGFLRLMEASSYKVTHGRGGVVSFLVPGLERSTRRVDLIIDIQERLRSGKGPGFEKWAKVYNLKQMAAALQFSKEHGLTEYAAVEQFHGLTEKLQTTEGAFSKMSELMGAVTDYAKTRPMFDGYKAARYSKKYLAEHGDELTTYRAARAAMNTLLDGGKLPPMAKLKEDRRKLAAEKKALYTEYHAAQREMREALTVKTNIDHLLGITAPGREKEQAR